MVLPLRVAAAVIQLLAGSLAISRQNQSFFRRLQRLKVIGNVICVVTCCFVSMPTYWRGREGDNCSAYFHPVKGKSELEDEWRKNKSCNLMKLQVEKKGGMAASSNARISWDTLHYCCISTQTQFRRSTPQENKSASNIPQSFGISGSSQELRSVPRLLSSSPGNRSSFRN